MKTKDIDPADVRVLYARDAYLVLGPLGCFYKGQRLTMPDGREMTITSIDPDGAGIARSDEAIATFGGHLPPAFRSFPCRSLVEVGPAPVMERVQAGMDAQQARNRREHGVELPADLAAAA